MSKLNLTSFKPVSIITLISHHQNLVAEKEQLIKDLRSLRGNGINWRNDIERDSRKAVQIIWKELQQMEKELQDFTTTTVVEYSPSLEPCIDCEDDEEDFDFELD